MVRRFQGCRSTEARSERQCVHVFATVLKRLEYMQWVGLSWVKVYSVVYYDYDMYSSMQSGFVSHMSYIHGWSWSSGTSRDTVEQQSLPV